MKNLIVNQNMDAVVHDAKDDPGLNMLQQNKAHFHRVPVGEQACLSIC